MCSTVLKEGGGVRVPASQSFSSVSTEGGEGEVQILAEPSKTDEQRRLGLLLGILQPHHPALDLFPARAIATGSSDSNRQASLKSSNSNKKRRLQRSRGAATAAETAAAVTTLVATATTTEL